MAPVTEPKQRDALFTIDTRPIPMDVSNRPEDDAPVAPAGVARTWDSDVARATRRVVAPPSLVASNPRKEMALQVGSIFAYAMLGAVLFHVAWWLLTT